MRLLAIETATADCSVAIAVGDAVLQAAAFSGHAKPSEQVPGLIRQLLAEAGIGISQLDAIAFDNGPGAFTGIRIGCGLAQGLALGADLPLLGVCSLRVLAMQAPEGRVLAMLDARMGEIYWTVCRRTAPSGLGAAEMLADARVESPASWTCPADLDSAVGDGLGAELAGADGAARVVRVATRLPAAVRVISDGARPRAADMLPLALADLDAGLAVAPELASPLYVRDKVALTAAEQLARRAAR